MSDLGKLSPGALQDIPLPAPSTSRTLRPRISRRLKSETTESTAMSEDPSSQTTNDTEPIDNESESPEEEQEIQCTGSTFKLEDDHGINSASTSAASSVSSTSLAKILNETAAQAQWASSSSQKPIARAPEPEPKPEEPQFEPLSSYTCPICFGPPMNATMTPCGHICCGSCLFAAVKSTLMRGGAIHAPAEANVPRCPVCRAKIPGWDGKGGGVIGLKVRTMLSL